MILLDHLTALPYRTSRILAIAMLLAFYPAGAADAEGLNPQDVARLRSVRQTEVSPDGEWVAYSLAVPRNPFDDENGPAWAELHLLGPDGRDRGFVTGEVNVGGLAWTPDGASVSFLAKREGDEHRALYVIPRDGGEARRVLSPDAGVGSYSFSPDGKRVAYLAAEEEPEEKKDLKEKGFNQEVYEEELHPTRVWIASIPGPGGQGEGDEDAEPRRLDLSGSASELHWSPDGDRLVVALAPTPLIDDAYMARRIKVVEVESGEVVVGISNSGKLGPVGWSPDGKNLAMISGADLHDPRAGRLMTVSASAGGAPRDLLPGLEGHVIDLAWKDADEIYAVIQEGVEASLETVGLDGSRRVVLPPGGPILQGVSVSENGEIAVLTGTSPSHPSEAFRAGKGQAERLTDSNPWLADRDLAEQEVVRFKARDGLEIQGLLIHPLNREEGKRAPLILAVHGGPESHHSNGWLTSYSSPGQMGAAAGYAVFYTNYRGSTGRGVEFSKLSQGDPAGKEFDDLVDAVDHLIASGLVDGAKVGITGGSYGGYASAWGSTFYSERFAASVMFVGISENISKIGTSDIPNELNLVHARRWPWDDWRLMLERSPIHYVEKARTPILILGGKDDTRVDPSQSLALYRYLKTLGKVPVRLVRYPGEGHGNRKAAARLDYNLRMLRWFDHYLQGEGGEPPPPAIDYPGEEEEEGDAEEGKEG